MLGCELCLDLQHVLGGVSDEDVGDGDSGRRSRCRRGVDLDVERDAAEQRAREAPDERVHGLVTWPAASYGSRQPQDAQLGDLQATWRRLEETRRHGEAAVHRRSQAAACAAHGRASRLQVPTSTAPQVDPDGRREAVGGYGQDCHGVQRPRQVRSSIRTHRWHALAVVAVIRPTTVRLVYS